MEVAVFHVSAYKCESVVHFCYLCGKLLIEYL